MMYAKDRTHRLLYALHKTMSQVIQVIKLLESSLQLLAQLHALRLRTHKAPMIGGTNAHCFNSVDQAHSQACVATVPPCARAPGTCRALVLASWRL
jgi:hypothetical protein